MNVSCLKRLFCRCQRLFLALFLAVIYAENAMDADKEIAKKFPYSEMSKNAWLPNTCATDERVINLRKFFEVVQLSKLSNENLLPCVACRRLSITEKSDFALIAWVQEAKIEARRVQTMPVDLKELTRQLPTIRTMTTKDPAVFCPELCELLANCGIAIVFLPHIGGSFLHGATFNDNSKIVMGLTVRGKDADKFWFSLFHEIGHILLGHLNRRSEIDDAAEREADFFARDILIPQDKFNSFVAQHNFSQDAIVSFANAVGIAPGIVVERLQKEGYLNFGWCNNLKEKYEITA